MVKEKQSAQIQKYIWKRAERKLLPVVESYDFLFIDFQYYLHASPNKLQSDFLFDFPQ